MIKRSYGFYLCVFFFIVWIVSGIFLLFKPTVINRAPPLCHQMRDISLCIIDPQNRTYHFGAQRAFQVSHQSPFFSVEKPWGHTLIGQKKVWVHAESALINRLKRQAYLCHNVTLDWNHGDYTVTTQKATIDEKMKMIYSTTPVKGKGVYGVFSGQGFTFNHDVLYLHGPARLDIQTD